LAREDTTMAHGAQRDRVAEDTFAAIESTVLAMIEPREPRIAPGLSAAYEAALYRVDAAPHPFVLRIGERAPDLEALHAEHGVRCSAFVTAWNPFGMLQPEVLNRRAQARLERELDELGYAMYPGAGLDPDGSWPGEESVLVLGLVRDAAAALGRAYGQNAVVWCGKTAVPELVMLRRG
jgi:hypothetical protein